VREEGAVPDGPIQHNVDMEAYDAALIEAGFEFVDDPEDDEDVEGELTFLVDTAMSESAVVN
jgi:hypothetical protein